MVGGSTIIKRAANAGNEATLARDDGLKHCLVEGAWPMRWHVGSLSPGGLIEQLCGILEV